MNTLHLGTLRSKSIKIIQYRKLTRYDSHNRKKKNKCAIQRYKMFILLLQICTMRMKSIPETFRTRIEWSLKSYFNCCVAWLLLSFLSCLFVWLVGFLTSSSTTRLYRGRAPRQERLTILRAATHETELGDHDFCLSRSHYTDTDPTCRERAATAGIEPGTSSPGVERSTNWATAPPLFGALYFITDRWVIKKQQQQPRKNNKKPLIAFFTGFLSDWIVTRFDFLEISFVSNWDCLSRVSDISQLFMMSKALYCNYHKS